MDAELIAAQILHARESRQCLDASSLPIDEHVAYAVQHLVTQHRENNGERQAGWKLGYTSEVMRAQMGIASPNFGPLTDAMLLTDDATLPSAFQPKVEPEIALVLGANVTESLTADECRAVVAEVRLALEVVDSIWCDYRFDWAHNTADGSSAAYAVIGPGLRTDDPAALEVSLWRNDELVGTGAGSAAMGDPYAALAWLTRELAARPRGLRAGDVVITGGLVAATTCSPGDVIAATCADVRVRVTRAAL